MKTVLIHRDLLLDVETLGKCYVKHDNINIEYIGNSLERGWHDNQNNISCVPEGEYLLKYEWSPRFKRKLWELYGVPNRRECKFHAANYWLQLNGCISLGNKRIDINNDGYSDVTSSKKTMAKFHKALKGETQAILIIKNI